MSSDHAAAAKAQRAEMCEEFLGPIMAEQRAAYLARIADIAATELDPRKRTDRITALSQALKILGNVETGLRAAIEAGAIAKSNIMKAEKIERMSAAERRLFGIIPTA